MQTALSPKNTKAELLAAFEEMRKKYEELQSQQTQPPLLKRKEEDMILQKTNSYTPTALEDSVAALRRKMFESLDILDNQLSEEGKKLSEIRNAISIEAARLQEARHLELGAQALDTLIAEFDRKEKEMEAKRVAMEETIAAEMARKNKERDREQEEYAYAQKIARKKEQDAHETESAKKEAAFQEKMNKKEMEIAEKAAELSKRAAEIAKMEEDVKNFPEKLTQALREAEQRAENNARKEFEIEKRLMEQKSGAERNTLETRVANLQEIVKAQTAEIKSLKDALATANQHAQTLAATVIESVSGVKQMKTMDVVKE